MARMWHIIARHKWVCGASITESHRDSDDARRFTATIEGWRNWKIFEGTVTQDILQMIIAVVMGIRERIQTSNDAVFDLPNRHHARTAEDLQADLIDLGRLDSRLSIPLPCITVDPDMFPQSQGIAYGDAQLNVDVFALPDNTLLLASGLHRYKAVQEQGRLSIPCTLHFGTRQEAEEFARQNSASC